jgi:hypothetical protein
MARSLPLQAGRSAYQSFIRQAMRLPYSFSAVAFSQLSFRVGATLAASSGRWSDAPEVQSPSAALASRGFVHRAHTSSLVTDRLALALPGTPYTKGRSRAQQNSSRSTSGCLVC